MNLKNLMKKGKEDMIMMAEKLSTGMDTKK